MTDFIAIGINHQKSPIHLREKFAFGYNTANLFLAKLKNESVVSEALYLKTCNRSEIYAVAGKDESIHDKIKCELCKNADLHFSSIENLWYTKCGQEALKHLFRVASSLDSMVVGEAQVLGQIKEAYFNARNSGMTGPYIDHAMLHAIQVAKKIRTETGIGHGQVSIASIAVDLALKLLKDISNLTVFVMGAGEMGALVVRHLKKHGADRILVANRTFEKAKMIAEHAGGEVIPWENMVSGLKNADIIVSSTDTKCPIVNRETLLDVVSSRSKPLFIIDLGTPRNIDPDVAGISGIHLFNIDDLQEIANENSGKRKAEADKAEEFIIEESDVFYSELSKPYHLATIAMLDRKFAAIHEQELQKTIARLPELTDTQRKVISSGMQSVLSKILHDPVREMKNSGCEEIEIQILSDSLLRLFHLNEE